MSGRASSKSGFSSRSQRTTIASGFVRSAAKNLPRTFSAGRSYDVDSSNSGSSPASATRSSQPITAARLAVYGARVVDSDDRGAQPGESPKARHDRELIE